MNRSDSSISQQTSPVRDRVKFTDSIDEANNTKNQNIPTARKNAYTLIYFFDNLTDTPR